MYKSWTLVQVLLYTWAFFYVCMAYAYLMYIRIHVRYTGDREVTAELAPLFSRVLATEVKNISQ